MVSKKTESSELSKWLITRTKVVSLKQEVNYNCTRSESVSWSSGYLQDVNVNDVW